jgi:hypothetical protein
VSRSGAIAAWDQRVELAAILADPDTVTEACIAFVGEPWRAWSNEQKASCRLRMTYALAAIIPKEQP